MVQLRHNVWRLAEVADFVTDFFSTKIEFLAKEIYQSCKIIAISANRC
jgi:hypothetical protein